ncbi:MAG: thioredoxin domain-containing protein [Magnetococcales bacterium]|nr:thioredoxin domain-containing protein [Magnetococcales bacterium]
MIKSPPIPDLFSPGRHGLLLSGLLLLAVLWASPSLAAATSPLATSHSPYLRHHAGDPVHWLPWEEATLALARQQDKPIFLSIGYSACHWCRVMGEETFQDAAVAQELNSHFIPILVDREERPDLDSFYLQVALRMTGRSGWPQNLFLTPDLLPLFAGNYYPPTPREGLPGLQDILVGLGRAWRENRPQLLAQESEIRTQLLAIGQPTPVVAADASSQDPRERAAEFLLKRSDARQGGFEESPKFPHPVALSLMLREGVRQGNSPLLTAVYTTLDRMAMGGIRDQLGGLFHRYAVDRFWRTPHYEIMLADNVLLARVYLEACQISHESRYGWMARTLLDALLERFLLADGGLATALGADSPNQAGHWEEGAYYRWSPAAVKDLLPAAERARWEAAVGVGNDDGQAGALWLRGEPQQMETLHRQLADLLGRVTVARQQRPPPARDDKVITGWNGLAVSSFALAARVLDEPRYLAVAQGLLAPLMAQFNQTGGLSHFRLGSHWVGEPVLDDYAFLLQALMDMYETDFQPKHLEAGWAVAQAMLARFQQPGSLLMHLTPVATESPIPPQTLVLDQQGIPAGNAVAWSGLARLNVWRLDGKLGEALAAVSHQLAAITAESPHQAGELLRLLDYAPATAREVILVGDREDPMVVRWLHWLRQRMGIGESVAVVAPTAAWSDWPQLANRLQQQGKPTAYICQGRICLEPVTDWDGFKQRFE